MDIQTLTLLLTNPLTFGALISWVLEQLAFFKDEKQSSALKIAAVIGICQLWAVVAFILNDTGAPLTVAVVRTIIYNGLAVAVGSQVFHLLVNALLPGLMDFALSLKATQPAIAASAASISSYEWKTAKDWTPVAGETGQRTVKVDTTMMSGTVVSGREPIGATLDSSSLSKG